MRLTTLTEIADFPLAGNGIRAMMKGSRNWSYAIAQDEVKGTMYIEKHGLNTATAAGDVIQDESAAIAIRTTASALEVISSDPGDDVGGAGAEGVKIFGVDINYNPISAELDLDGTTLFGPTTEEFLYVYRAKIINSGAVFNIGTITIRETGAGATLALISPLYGQTQKCVFPVFAGCKLYIDTMRMEGSKTGILTGQLNLVEYELGEGKRVRHPILFSDGKPIPMHWPNAPKIFNEKTLVWIEAKSISAGAEISASFDGVLMRYADSTP